VRQPELVEIKLTCAIFHRHGSCRGFHVSLAEHHVIESSQDGLVLYKVDKDVLLRFIGHFFELFGDLQDVVNVAVLPHRGCGHHVGMRGGILETVTALGLDKRRDAIEEQL